MVSELIVEEYRDFGQLAQRRLEWDALAEQENMPPSHQFDWLKLLWDIHGEGKELLILMVREQERLVGIAPLTKEREWRKGVRICLLKPLNIFSLHGTQFIVAGQKNEIMKAIFAHLRKAHGEWSLWSMSFQKGEEHAAVFESFLKNHHYQFSTQDMERSPYLCLRETWDEKLKTLQSRFRTALRSREKRLKEKGEVVFRFLDSPQDVQEGLAAIRSIEETSWKAAAQTAITHDLNQWHFYERYAPLAASQRTLRLPVLYLNEEPIAYDYSLYRNGIYYLLKTSYKNEWESLYPGFVLRKFVMEWLYADNAKEIDFLGKDEDWKMKWTETVREHVTYHAFSSNLRSKYVLAFSKLAAFAKGYRERRVTPPAVTETEL